MDIERRPAVPLALLTLAVVPAVLLAWTLTLDRTPAEPCAAAPEAREVEPPAGDEDRVGARTSMTWPGSPERASTGRVPGLAAKAYSAGVRREVDRGAPSPVEGSIRGTVVDAFSGQPVPAFTVSYHRADKGEVGADLDLARAVERQAADGRFHLAQLPRGRWSVTVDPRASGYERIVIRDVRVPAEAELAVRVDRGAHVEGRVLDGLGRPIVDLQVRLEPAPAAEVLAHPAAVRTTDEEGRYLFTRVVPGAYRLACPGPRAREGVDLEIAAGQRVEQDLRLPDASALNVSVRDPEGAPLAEAGLLLAGRGGFRRSRTDPGGDSRLSGLTPGRYALRVSRDGFLPEEAELELAPRGDLPLEVVLRRRGR